jgi:hypothetical protein
MTEASRVLIRASNTDAATVEQRHFLASALNTFMYSGPPVSFMAFRHVKAGPGRKRQRAEELDPGQQKVWRSVADYEKLALKERRTTCKSR